MSIELRHIRAFQAVAEELHFRRAAERLNTAQPALSRTIRWLEQELGADLFLRTTRSVSLTEAGRVFQQECHGLLRTIDQAIVNTRRAAAGDIGHLSVAYMDFAINGPLPAILEQFRRRHPGIHVSLFHMPTSLQRNAIINHEIDVGFLIGPFQGTDIGNLTVTAEALVAVVPQSHHLAGSDGIGLAELADEPFVLGSHGQWAAFRRLMDDICVAEGFLPNVVQEASTSDGIFGLVAAQLGVTVYPECARTYRRPALAYVPIRDLAVRAETVAAWPAGAVSPSAGHFIAVVRDFVEVTQQPARREPTRLARS